MNDHACSLWSWSRQRPRHHHKPQHPCTHRIAPLWGGGGDALACPPSYTAASLSGRDAVLALLVGPDAEKNAELLDFAWHILFGQPAVIHAPYMHTH